MGATAIEDKLQDGVPEAIANFAKVRPPLYLITLPYRPTGFSEISIAHVQGNYIIQNFY